MNKKDLQKFFSADYTNFKSFADNVLAPVFGEKLTILDYAEDMIKTKEDKSLARKHKIVSVLHFADIDAFNEVKVFDITVDNSCSLTMSRVGIKEFVRRILFSYTQALIVFHYENTTDRSWRLSYMFKEDKQTAVTPAKRFTYVFGKNYSGKTAAERFEVLSNSEMDKAKDFIEAFSVEALTKEFFTKYEAHYKKFCKYIYENKNDESKFGRKFTEIDDKAVRDYVKKMMGRIVFLHFLQRKGWLNGDQNFMLNTFRNSEYKDDFLDSVLEPLFFAFLNTKPEDRKVEFEKHNKQKGEKKWDKKYINEWKEIPYLNGGLFEADAEDPPASVFPAEYFEDLLVLFSEYNFTIDENDTSDAVIGVDPEMLGKIFESLLEDNKDKGAFYTPKEIVQYMCRESLVAYLVEKIGKKAAATDKAEDFVRRFVNDPYAECEKIKEEGYAKMLNDMYELLRDVKICDPAIGSGAFPMGMLNELVSCCDAINVALGTEIPRVELKKHIIQNNIYGVDIEKGAIDIARLRFWLSIVVDSEKPEALPNFDYKFMQGNSLLESYKGIDLTTTTQKKFDGQITLFENVADCERKFLRDKLDKYFNCSNHSEKEILRKEIHEKVFNVLRADKIGIGKDHLKVTDPAELFADIDLSANDKFFLWHTWFADVFNRPNGCNGFDIVIGNPPYIDSETMTRVMPNLREEYGRLYNCAKGNWDIFVLFVELGINLLNNTGTYSFIIPNKLIAAKYTEKLREYLSVNTLVEIRDYGGIPVFTNAAVYPATIIGQKGEQRNREIKFSVMKDINEKSIDNTIKCNEFHNLLFWDICFQPHKDFLIFTKIINNTILSKINGISVTGAATVSEAYLLKEFLYNSEECTNAVKIVNTGTIDRYTNLWGISTMQYIKGKYLYPVAKEKDVEKISKRRLQQAKSKKIIVAGMSKVIEAIYDNGDTLAGKSTTIITGEEKCLKFLLGVINSHLASYFSNIAYNSLKMAGGFINIGVRELEQLPIPSATPTQQHPIINLVDRILNAKKENPQTDTSRMEKEIDRLVYELYGLTEDEIKIVEGNSL